MTCCLIVLRRDATDLFYLCQLSFKNAIQPSQSLHYINGDLNIKIWNGSNSERWHKQPPKKHRFSKLCNIQSFVSSNWQPFNSTWLDPNKCLRKLISWERIYVKEKASRGRTSLIHLNEFYSMKFVKLWAFPFNERWRQVQRWVSCASYTEISSWLDILSYPILLRCVTENYKREIHDEASRTHTHMMRFRLISFPFIFSRIIKVNFQLNSERDVRK